MLARAAMIFSLASVAVAEPTTREVVGAMLAPLDRPAGAPAPSVAATGARALGEGTYIMDRLVFLHRFQDGRQEMLFLSDGIPQRDAPMIPVPNRNLEVLERLSGQGRKARVSGVVLEYGGRNHFLIERVSVVRDIR